MNYLLTDSWPGDTAPDGREWVDLGLPSGTLWATCNVSASAPVEYGYYFAWGESLDQGGLGGIYWSCTLYGNDSDDALWEDYRRDVGRTVRPVLVYHY